MIKNSTWAMGLFASSTRIRKDRHETMSLTPDWTTKKVSGQPEWLHRETLLQEGK